LGRWECVKVSPSYEAFALPGASSGPGPLTTVKRVDPAVLLKTANQQLVDDCVQVVSIDMPLSRDPITSRRLADDLISRAFGKFGCGTHSPSGERPGAISDDVRNQFAAEGFQLHTTTPAANPPFSLIETFPHPALLALCRCDYRLPYKVSKARSYWPTTPPSERRTSLKAQMRRILDALGQDIAEIPIDLYRIPENSSARQLKAVEDMIDALVCAWVGIKYTLGEAEAYGNSSAAIWVPTVTASHTNRAF
jgi:predicted RNase H-like nuclease